MEEQRISNSKVAGSSPAGPAIDYEEYGAELVVDIVRLSRAGKPYKKELACLKEVFPLAPGVREMVGRLIAALEANYPPKKK